MQRRVALLRGINLGPHKRIAMGELRDALGEAGYEEVQTYVQSGNVVLGSDAPPNNLEGELERLIRDRRGFDVPVIVRTRRALAALVKANPLPTVPAHPQRY